MGSRLSTFLLAVALGTGSAAPAAAADLDPAHAEKMAAGRKLFRDQVRGILVKNCVRCHGGEETQSAFDLTTREGLLKGGEYEVPGVEPGNADDSWLYQLVTHVEEPKMPEEASKLRPEQLAHLRAWIELGAPYDGPLVEKAASAVAWTEREVTAEDRQYWAFQPLRDAKPPDLADDTWSRTPVDRFVLERMRRDGLQPNPSADRRLLVRRAYLDLIGLPPAPEEVEAFEQDPDPQAYEKLLDRLLASPHYGERWARHWMDVARFAESEGGEHDYDRKYAYHYRDFLIQAFNRDLPYDQFVKWQLAGDEFAPQDPLAMMATGFLTAGTFPTQLTEREFEQARYDQLDDMAGTAAVAFLGLTVGCARCHDHKFDPIPARDYYRFVAHFTTTIRSELQLPVAPGGERPGAAEQHRGLLAQRRAERERFEREQLPALFQTYVAGLGRAPGDWELLEVPPAGIQAATRLAPQPDGSLLAEGPVPALDEYTLTVRTPRKGMTALRLEALTHPSLPRGGPGRAPNGNFCLGDIGLTAAPLDGSQPPVEVALRDPRATHQQNKDALSAAASLDADPNNTGWAVDFGGIGRDQAVLFALDTPVGFAGGTELKVTLRFHHFNSRHAIGRLRLSITSADPSTVPLVSDRPEPPGNVAAVLRTLRAGGQVDGAALGAAQRWFAATLPEWRELTAAIEKLERKQAAVDVPTTTVQVGSEGVPKVKHHADGRGYPHFYPETYYLKRGDPSQKEGVAQPGFLQILTSAPDAERHWSLDPPPGARTSYRRRALAEWMTDIDYGAGPLAARVMVNRIWQQHLGRGIVATANDFGHQAPPPTHPELLEWLAADFVRGGWRIKALHKRIMTSAVYLQSSDWDAERAAIDPENLLHWRRSVRRLEAEAIRDQMLAVSGQLDAKLYGPGTRDEAMRRRSIYFFLKRSQVPTILQLFDLPEPLVSQGHRPTTTIAPQALLFMNNPQVRTCASGLASRVTAAAGPSDDAAVAAAYRLALGRAPTGEELRRNTAFLTGQAESYRAGGRADARELALADLCQVMFSLNEFVFLP